MSGVELGLAIVATVDLCLKYGAELKRAYSSFQNADREIEERLLLLASSWLRYEKQLNFVRSIHESMHLEHQKIYYRILLALQAKLEHLNSMFVKVLRPADAEGGPLAKKFRYVLKKESLDRAIEDLRFWQNEADPSWFLLMRLASPKVDTLIAGGSAVSAPTVSMIRAGLNTTAASSSGVGLMLEYKDINQMIVADIPFSDARTAKRANSSKVSYIFTKINVHVSANSPPSRFQALKRETRDLARRLQHDEPEAFSLLACKGFTIPDVNANSSIILVLRTPPSKEFVPRSLRDLLLNIPAPQSLSQRFAIARQLATAVAYVHIFGFVHKNIRPESVLSFASTDTSQPRVYLAGFEMFRRDEAWTQKMGDDALDRNVYRHPSRQGLNPDWEYIMQHDIYSLGVCLLEIGLWQSLVDYQSTTTGLHPRVSALLSPAANAGENMLSSYLGTALEEKLLSLSHEELPRYMGTKYAEIVRTCLTCLEPDNEDFGDEKELQDEDGISVGVRYIEKILSRLNALNV
ncbi:hypothetical protein Daus18300_009651 [Diaporthe australafricana]|uniref:Protein kinase domain-containing protein n=1 Tax=Diaporthe australafricana TaxID=127596 RepID=A0ABR3WDG3_9PEZI